MSRLRHQRLSVSFLIPFVLVGFLVGLTDGTSVARAQDPIEVVTTIPVLKDLTEQVGRSRVRVKSLLTGLENEHTYSPKPTDLVAVRNARLLFEIGLGLEVWVGSLVKNAGSPSLRVVTTSRGVPLIRDDSSDPHDTRHGDGAPLAQGNPHIWMDPDNVEIMLRHIADALIEVDPVHADEYRRNLAAYREQMDRLRGDLLDRVGRLTDRRIVAHHPAWPYLAKRFGFEIAATIQIHSGTEPSALHVQHLIGKIRKDRLKVIASEIQLSQRIPDLLSKETGARVVILTTLPGGLPGTESYLDMLRYNVLKLADALEH
ncbi:MAG: metal ABC transporter substrate-binding protein [Nitrospira sp.]|nr:metal ABC transporter substrate-binding protein [Nitrospira sp.]